jgi:uncharacterized RDD family membrane protein YckC
MIKDIQKAGMWKRISAALLDIVVLIIIAEAFILLFSWMTGFSDHLKKYDALENELADIAEEYYKEYGVDVELIANTEEFSKLSKEEQDAYKVIVEAADKAFQKDSKVLEIYYEQNDVLSDIISRLLIVITFPILISFTILEFAIPLIFKNGQTLGKKAFGIAVMRVDGIKVTPFMMFARGVLGKCTFGLLVPIYLIIMVIFSILDIRLGAIVLLAILIAQIVILIATKNRTPIHDMLAQTVTVDMSSQMIFDTPDERDEYYNRITSESAADFGRSFHDTTVSK